jgi:hypothetical protein
MNRLNRVLSDPVVWMALWVGTVPVVYGLPWVAALLVVLAIIAALVGRPKLTHAQTFAGLAIWAAALIYLFAFTDFKNRARALFDAGRSPNITEDSCF